VGDEMQVTRPARFGSPHLFIMKLLVVTDKSGDFLPQIEDSEYFLHWNLQDFDENVLLKHRKIVCKVLYIPPKLGHSMD
jgi:hypothetical protein